MGYAYALFFLLIGTYLTYDGLHRGALLNNVDIRNEYTLVVEGVLNQNGRDFFPDYKAYGYVLELKRPSRVEIFGKEYRNLKRGSSITVYKTNSSEQEFIYKGKYKESKPIFRVLVGYSSWHIIPGLAMLILGAFIIYDKRRQELTQT